MSDDPDAAQIPTLDARVAALEDQMAALRPQRKLYRDAWLTVITGLVVLGFANLQSTTDTVGKNQHANTVALCSFDRDLQKRVDTTLQFLQEHPNGIPGIPAATLRISVVGQQATLKSLSSLSC